MAYEEMIIRKQQSILMPFLVKKKYKEKLHYQADMNFKLGNSKAIELGEKRWLNRML
jgi:hypothetical protein